MNVRTFARASLLALLTILSSGAWAQSLEFPPGFRTQQIATNGTTLHVRVGGTGSPVLLLHGYGDTGDMWVPLATQLMKNHTVIVPDLRGMGLSAVANAGFSK